MVKLKGNIQVILSIMVVLILLNGSYSGLKLLSTMGSYSTGYQGARAQYAGVTYQGNDYTNSEKFDSSRARFDTTLSFDPDQAQQYMPNLEGEMTSVFVPSESLSNFPSWIPSEWQRSISYMRNPLNSWDWDIENTTYRMEEWILRWYFSIGAEWDEHLLWHAVGEAEWHDQRYHNTEIWFQIDLTPVWYFEGADNAYFAIAKMQFAEHARLDALDNQGNDVEPEKGVSVQPESQGSILPIYYGEFAKSSDATKTAVTYQGKKLNPDLFTSRVYTYFTLENFGTWAWVPPLGFNWRYKGDVVTVAVDMHVFVIGEWKVKDVQSIEQVEGDEGYGRTAKIGGEGFGLGDWLGMPENRLLLVLLAGFIVFLIIAILAPTVLISIMAILGSRRRR